MKKINHKTIFILFVLMLIVIVPNFSNAAKVSVGKVKGVKVTSKGTDTLSLKWKKAKKATGYKVYVYNSSKNKYQCKAKTSNKTVKLSNLQSAKKYKIKVRGYKTVKKKNYNGKYSSTITTATNPTQVKGLQAKKVADSALTLSWTNVTRASGYKIYIYNESSKKYVYKTTSKKNSVYITGLSQLKTYKFIVRAFKQVNSKEYYGLYSTVVKAYTKPAKVSGIKINRESLTSAELIWNKNSKADGYKIYLYNNSKSNYECIADVKNNKYSISNIDTSKIYSYKIRCYVKNGNSLNYGPFSDVYEVATYPDKVTGFKVSAKTTNSISLKWNKSQTADGYAIYVYRESYQTYRLYKITSNTSIKITDLDPAKFYKIYIKAYIDVNNKKYYSSMSDIISQKTTSTSTEKAGIDVSQHQGNIDWNEVKGMGIDFAILRLGWIGNRDNHTIDTRFEEYYKECKRLKIPIGVYVYCYAKTVDAAKSGAKWTVEKLKGKSLELPVFIDMEDSSIVDTGKSNLSKMCIEYNKIVAKAKFTPGIYANRNWFDNYLDSSLRDKYTCWIAHYTSSERINYKGSYEIWQYSSAGLSDGINGNVDLDIMYVEDPAK